MHDVTKEVRRLCPCPAYDVEGMESWLTDLAREEGLLLIQDGIFAGVAAFEKGEPKQVKYRLGAVSKFTGPLDPDGLSPDPEAVELAREFHWECVARWGSFYIYRTDDPSARDLNTDSEVQALAIRNVKKYRAGRILWCVCWLILYPLSLLGSRSGILRSTVEIGTPLVLLGVFLVVWTTAGGILELRHLRRLEKKLREEGALAEGKDWRRGVPYQVKSLAQTALIAVWVILLLTRWSASMEYRERQPIDPDSVPFATIRDFGTGGYAGTLTGLDDFQERSDLLAPRNITWSEHAGVETGEMRYRITGGLEVEYYEMAAPFLAGWMARELTPWRSTGPRYEVLEPPPLDVDYAAAFVDVFPTVVLQKENEVLRASFYQTSEETLALEEWAAILADSLTGQGTQRPPAPRFFSISL